ncbi:dienelactone hydrolase [Branchiibius hedensis]|uniref:Dienelactone hydrolase n=1 Tax=Branchiibius hedensis TaxID=672460 RepID=A0A2Y9C279_9MICO|nr:dienelactone hydrolase family protein [Branchiibius hedensis]PWJ26822.1 dienelactone hydrolase [Branchiibius hedensis]SSA35633.1 Dienelactone hydrolase [Branchiibius hedensis]
MTQLNQRDVTYRCGSVELVGYLVTAADLPQPGPAVLLIHDAFGLTRDMRAIADRLARLGTSVFAADVWGDGQTFSSPRDAETMIGTMLQDRSTWLARIDAAAEAASQQPEITGPPVALGYCFGGSSALEYLRTGGRLRGVIAIHPGLDLLAPWGDPTQTDGWLAGASVLLCCGADDPMATASQREQLVQSLSASGVEWELDLYSDTKHAFSSVALESAPPNDVIGYNARSAARAWNATLRLLHEVFPQWTAPDSEPPITT